MGHTFRKLYDTQKRDDFVLCASLGQQGAVQLGVVTDAPSSAPSAVGTIVDQVIRGVVQSYSLRLAGNEEGARTTDVQSLIATLVVEVQDALRGLMNRDAVTNVAVAATCGIHLFYFVIGDSFVLLLRGRESGSAEILHLGATSVWNGREPVTRDNIEAPRIVKIEGRKYIGGDLPPIFPLPGEIPSVEIGPGDWVLVASDGLTAHVEPAEIFRNYENADSCEGFARDLEASVPSELRDDVSVAVFEPHVPSVRDVLRVIDERKNVVAAELAQKEAEVSARMSRAQHESLESLGERHRVTVQDLTRRIADFDRGAEGQLRDLKAGLAESLCQLETFTRRIGTLEAEAHDLRETLDGAEKSLRSRISDLEARVEDVSRRSSKIEDLAIRLQRGRATIEEPGQSPVAETTRSGADHPRTPDPRNLTGEPPSQSLGGSAKRRVGDADRSSVAEDASETGRRSSIRRWLPFLVLAGLILPITVVLGWLWRVAPKNEPFSAPPAAQTAAPVEVLPILMLGDTGRDFTSSEPFRLQNIRNQRIYARVVDQDEELSWTSKPRPEGNPCGQLKGYSGRVVFLSLLSTRSVSEYDTECLKACWPGILDSEFVDGLPDSASLSLYPPEIDTRAPVKLPADHEVLVWLAREPQLRDLAQQSKGRES